MGNDRWPDFVDACKRFSELAQGVVNDESGASLIRETLVGTRPGPALMLLLTRSFDYRERFLPEILVAIADGPASTLLLARDALRSLRRDVLERRVPEEMRPILLQGDDEHYSRLAEVIVELRLESALHLLREIGRERGDPDILEVVNWHEGIETDESRWGRLVVEWPIVQVDGRSRK